MIDYSLIAFALAIMAIAVLSWDGWRRWLADKKESEGRAAEREEKRNRDELDVIRDQWGRVIELVEKHEAWINKDRTDALGRGFGRGLRPR